MALTYSHIKILFDLKRGGFLDLTAPSIMEFGEQNWYDDVDPSELVAIARALHMSEESIKRVEDEILLILAETQDGSPNSEALWDLAKLYYRLIFDYKVYAAVDLNGTSVALKYDLNQKLPITDRYDVVTNIGTGEHVFNQYIFFKNMHDLTKDNGFMIHSLPNQGCYDHGFFNYHPTFVFDIAEANQYEIPCFVYTDATKTPVVLTQIFNREDYVRLAVDHKLSPYSGLIVIFKKPAISSEFQIPMQGYYSGTLSPELKAAWEKLEK